MNANNIVVPRWQQGRCLAFRQSTWKWHVQVRNEATSEQEDDLEHTGQTYFSHSQRQPAHLNGASVQARGPRGLLLRGSISSATPTRGCRQMSSQVSALGLVLCLQVFAFGELTLCLYQLGGWHESCQ